MLAFLYLCWRWDNLPIINGVDRYIVSFFWIDVLRTGIFSSYVVSAGPLDEEGEKMGKKKILKQ